MPHAAEALQILDGLGVLQIGWDAGDFGPLTQALAALTSLSSLCFGGDTRWEGAQPPQPLDSRPGPLRELFLRLSGKAHALRAISRLGAVTKLELEG